MLLPSWPSMKGTALRRSSSWTAGISAARRACLCVTWPLRLSRRSISFKVLRGMSGRLPSRKSFNHCRYDVGLWFDMATAFDKK